MNDLNHLTICGTLINDSVFNISEKILNTHLLPLLLTEQEKL